MMHPTGLVLTISIRIDAAKININVWYHSFSKITLILAIGNS
jgi:hypothetical protein